MIHVIHIILSSFENRITPQTLDLFVQDLGCISLLLEDFLLTVDDLTNTAVLIGLAKNVYPKYDIIKKYLGANGVKQHIDYVKDHMEDSIRHTNIAKYLNKSVSRYIKARGWE